MPVIANVTAQKNTGRFVETQKAFSLPRLQPQPKQGTTNRTNYTNKNKTGTTRGYTQIKDRNIEDRKIAGSASLATWTIWVPRDVR